MRHKMLPAHRLARSLRRQWEPEKAVVLADWCEEHGLTGIASSLRQGPSAKSRARIEALTACFGDSTSMRVYWQLDWLPTYKPDKYEAKLLKNRDSRWGSRRIHARLNHKKVT